MNGAGNSAIPVTSGSNTETTVVSDSTIQTFQNLELQQTFSTGPRLSCPRTCPPTTRLLTEGHVRPSGS